MDCASAVRNECQEIQDEGSLSRWGRFSVAVHDRNRSYRRVSGRPIGAGHSACLGRHQQHRPRGSCRERRREHGSGPGAVPSGTDPHTFQPTPDSIKTLSQARVVFFNGAGLEEWWDKTIRSVTKPEVPVIELSKGLATIRIPGHGDAEAQDPHVWLDPNLVKTYADRSPATA